MTGKISMDQLDKSWKNTKKHGPSWSMAGKPAMISGAAVPSWVRSIPGPKYNVETDAFKTRSPAWKFRPLDGKKVMTKSESAPSALPSADELDRAFEASQPTVPKWTMRSKPAMISGEAVPSWVNSIPGPKYDPKVDAFRKSVPKYSIGEKLDMVIGGVIPSWVNSIPGPKYTYNTDDFKNRQPVYTIGAKLKTEGEIMATRSPGPIYGGSAIDAVAQARVDSTKRRTCAPSFGCGPRWEGKTYDMILSGALARYETGKFGF